MCFIISSQTPSSAQEMNATALKTMILIVTLLHGGEGQLSDDHGMTSDSEALREMYGPCLDKGTEDAYDRFLKQHILSKAFDRNSLDEWKT